MMRRLALVILVVALLPTRSAHAQPSEKRAEIRFSFSDAVSAVDRVSVEQGVWFVQDAFIDVFGADAPGVNR